MKLRIDTDDVKTILLEMTDKEIEAHFSESAEDLAFCFAALAAKYIQQMDHAFSPNVYHKVRELLVKLFDLKLRGIIDILLSDDDDNDTDDDDDDEYDELLAEEAECDELPDEDIENLRHMLENSGHFTREEIDALVNLVIDSGSIGTASDRLRALAKENGIDLDK